VIRAREPEGCRLWADIGRVGRRRSRDEACDLGLRVDSAFSLGERWLCNSDGFLFMVISWFGRKAPLLGAVIFRPAKSWSCFSMVILL
jgi:hypothetical protein